MIQFRHLAAGAVKWTERGEVPPGKVSMGWLSKKTTTESQWASEVLSMDDVSINKLLKARKVPGVTAKQLRQQLKDAERTTSGEKGLGAIRAALQGGGTGNKNYQNVPLKDRVHPARYKQILEKEAKKKGFL